MGRRRQHNARPGLATLASFAGSLPLRWAAVALLLTLGAALTATGFLLARSSEERQLVASFDRAAATRVAALQVALTRAEDDVAALAGLFAAEDEVEPRAFRAVASGMVQRHPETQALEWAPWVLRAERAAVERAERARGLDLTFTERRPDGALRAAGERLAYAPVLVVEPARGNARTVGFDLLSSPQRRAALERARVSGALTATEPVELLQGRPGLLLAQWVLRSAPRVAGWAVGVYRVEDLVAAALGPLPEEGVDAEVLDPATLHGAASLVSVQGGVPGLAHAAPAPGLSARLELRAPVRVADRTWIVHLWATPAFIASGRSWRPWALLAAGLLATAGLAALASLRLCALRRRAHEAARLSEQRLAFLVDRSPLGVIELDRFGEIVAWNGTATRLFGYAEPEVLRRHFTLLLPVERRAPVAARWERFLRGEDAPRVWTWEALKRDGAHIHCDFHAARLGGPDGAGAVLLVADVTERRRAEREHRRLWQAVQGSPVAVVITDPSGVIEFVNPAFERMSGWSARDALGARPSILKSGAHDASFYADLWRRVLAGEVWTGELCNRKRTGELYWERASIAAVHDEGGAITGLVAIKEDVTERRAAAAELERARSRAEEAARAKSAFLAAMSHEIRTPLNAVLGHAQLTARDPSLGPAAREHLAVIERSGAHLLALLNDVLEMSKLEAGRVSARPEPFDLAALLAEVGALFGPRAQEKGLAFAVERAPGLPARLLADAAKVRQVLSNLVGNAVKFTQAGAVTLRVRAAPSASDAALVAAEVVDTGPGIAAGELPLLFQEFQQAEAGLRARSGTGLGLAISRAYARLLGGDVTVESTAGRGSTFHFTFEAKVLAGAEHGPALRDEAAPAAVTAPLVLPVAVAGALRDASRRGDFDAVLSVLDRLAPERPDAAERLRAAARRYDGAALLSMIGAQPRPEA